MAGIFGDRGFDDLLGNFVQYRVENDRVLKAQREQTREYDKQIKQLQQRKEKNQGQLASLKSELSENKKLQAIIMSNGRMSEKAVQEVNRLSLENEAIKGRIEAKQKTAAKHTNALVKSQDLQNERAAEYDKLVASVEERMSSVQKASVGIGLGAAFIVSEFVRFDDRTKSIRDNLGVSFETAREFQKTAQNVTAQYRIQGVEYENVVTAASALFDVEASLDSITESRLANISLIAEKTNVSAQAAAQVSDLFGNISSMTDASSDSLTSFVALMANDLGVGAGKVLEDIAANAGTASKFFAGQPKDLAKAAIEARRLELSLSDMDSVASSLLDIESSIEAQFQAQALTGKNINFDLARRLALEGDIAGSTKEVLSQLGSIEEFNKMNVIQRQSIADAAGMELSQLSKALTNQKALASMTATQRAEYDMLNDRLEGNNATLAEKLLMEKQSLTVQETWNAQVQELREQLSAGLIPLLTQVSSFLSENVSLVQLALGGFVAIKTAAAAYKGLAIATLAIEKARALFAQREAIANIVGGAFKSMSFLPVAGAIAAGGIAAAGIAGMFGAFKSVDDVAISPDRNVITGPAGQFQLNKDDTIIAGTNLGGGGGGTGNSAALVAKIDELIQVIKMARPVNLDGIKVGEVMSLGNIGAIS